MERNRTHLRTAAPWWQIADRLRRAIEHGEFKVGDALPSESQLNEVFGVSRTTARSALDRLEQEGLIFRKAGKGSVVLDPKVPNRRRMPNGSTPTY